MLHALKSLYDNVSCCLRINNLHTDFFDVLLGVKQGCILSPLLFSLYINECIAVINGLNKGIPIGHGERVSVLAYADDLVLLAEREEDLQEMLQALSEWCEKWDLKVNKDKTKVIHYRSPSMARTNFKFTCMGNEITCTDKYKYLGLWFTEHLDMEYMSGEVAKSAHRALGLLVSKAKAAGGMPYQVFTKLYQSLVQTIIDYGSAVWGHRSISSINAVQNRAARFFLGVTKSTPNAAIQGELAWTTPVENQWVTIGRQWCRLLNMPNLRLTKRIFIWAKSQNKNWITYVKRQLQKLDMHHISDVNATADSVHTLALLRDKMHEITIRDWCSELNRENAKRGAGGNKLRTYRNFKTEYEAETYLQKPIPWRHRRALAQFRCASAPIRVETGRYERLALADRHCFACVGQVEDELHVVTKCPLYQDLRLELFNECFKSDINFETMTNENKLYFILSDVSVINIAARILHQILTRRRSFIYQ